MGIFEYFCNPNVEENTVVSDNTAEIFDTNTINTTQPVDTFINEVKKTLLNGDSVVIKRFGKFYVKEIPEHITDNKNIRATKKILFTPDKSLEVM